MGCPGPPSAGDGRPHRSGRCTPWTVISRHTLWPCLRVPRGTGPAEHAPQAPEQHPRHQQGHQSPRASILGPTPALGALPRDTGPSAECSKQPLIKHATAETAREEQRRDSPIGLLGASQEGPVRQDAQGARQEVPLPATPAAAALPAARERCGARGPCERGRAPSPCPHPRPDTAGGGPAPPTSTEGSVGTGWGRRPRPRAPAAALPGLRLCRAGKFLSLGETS